MSSGARSTTSSMPWWSASKLPSAICSIGLVSGDIPLWTIRKPVSRVEKMSIVTTKVPAASAL